VGVSMEEAVAQDLGGWEGWGVGGGRGGADVNHTAAATVV
jgi:hypothetical protein